MHGARIRKLMRASTTCAMCTVQCNDVCISFTLALKRVAQAHMYNVHVWACVGIRRVWTRYVDELRSMDDTIKQRFLNATIVWPGLHFRCVCKLYNVCVRVCCLHMIDSWMPIAMQGFQLNFQLGQFNFGCRHIMLKRLSAPTWNDVIMADISSYANAPSAPSSGRNGVNMYCIPNNGTNNNVALNFTGENTQWIFEMDKRDG